MVQSMMASSNVTVTNASTVVTWNSSANCHVVSYYFHAGMGVFICLVAAISAIGNSLVLFTYTRYSSLRTSSNLFVMNLTTADLLMSLIDFPMFAASSFNGCWMLGYTGCQMYGFTTSLFSITTINTLAAISFDRYFAVVHRLSPMHRMKKSTSGLIIMSIWVISITWSLLPLIGMGPYRLEGLGTSCTFNYIDRSYTHRLFFLNLVTFNFFIPLLIITYSYSQIFAYVKRVKRELKSLETDNNTAARRQHIATKAEIRTAITVIVVIAIFCTAWTPYVSIAFIGLFGPRDSITPLISAFPNILAKVSTISNPILYTFGHQELRRKVKTLFISKRSRSSLRSTYATAGITIQENTMINDIPIRPWKHPSTTSVPDSTTS